MANANTTLKHEIIGSGAPLVLLPGALTGWLSWVPHTQALAQSRQVIRMQLCQVDLGLTNEPLPPDYSAQHEITALDNTLNQLNINQADFAAWSYGGLIALSYAIHNPERIHSLTLIEPPAFWVLRSQGALSQAIIDEQAFMQTLAVEEVSEEQLIRFLQIVGVTPPGVDPRTMPQWSGWYEHRQSLRMGDAPYHHKEDLARVRAFNKPVLLIKGEGSSTFYHHVIDILAEKFPNAQVVSFPAGHAPHLVSMQPFMDRFTRFLTEAD